VRRLGERAHNLMTKLVQQRVADLVGQMIGHATHHTRLYRRGNNIAACVTYVKL
jgi:hypothetical protein